MGSPISIEYMLPIGILTTLAALGSLLGRLLQVLFRVLRKRFPAFDYWAEKCFNLIFKLLKIVGLFFVGLVVLFVALLLSVFWLQCYLVYFLRRQAAKNSSTSPEQLQKSSKSPGVYAYQAAILFIALTIFLVRLLGLSVWYYFVCSRDRQVANNPSTSPEQLQTFSESPDFFTRRAVASNPNTPPEVLLKLGQQFPKQLLKNPAFNLMLLENPNLLLTMPKETLKRILMLKDVPIGFLEQAAFSPQINVEIARAIAKHPKAPGYVLEKISAFCQDKSVHRSLLKRSDLPPAVLEKLKANDPR